MAGIAFEYVDTVYGFSWVFFLCLVGCFRMIIWTPTVLSVLYACVSYFCIRTCAAQLSMFHVERCSRNTLIIIIMHTLPSKQASSLVEHRMFPTWDRVERRPLPFSIPSPPRWSSG